MEHLWTMIQLNDFIFCPRTLYYRRLQYSVFEIMNSPRILDNIKTDIENKFEKRFGQGDSVLIFSVPDTACVGRFGYPVNEETDLILG